MQPETVQLGTSGNPTLVWKLENAYCDSAFAMPCMNNNANVKMDRVTAPTASASMVLARRYSYDSANRLMQAGEYSVTSGGMAPALNATCSDTNVWCEKYGFDGYGSRSISNRSGLTAALNEPSLFGPTTNQVMNAGWVYDEAGNVTTDGGQGSLNTASHDGDNRLVSPGTASGVSYGYDAEGRRVRRTVSGVPTTFVYGADHCCPN